MNVNFDNAEKAQAQLKSLDRAIRETVHRGATLEEDDSLTDKNVSKGVIDENPEEKHLAVVNQRTDQMASIVSDRYEVVQHEEAFKPLIEAIKNLGLNPDGHIETYNEGDVAVMKIFFQDFNLEIDGDSEYFFGLFAMNSYDKTAGFQVHPYGVRLTCSNQFTARNLLDNVESIHHKHLGDIDTVELVGNWLEELQEEREEFAELIHEARETYFDDVEIVLRNAGFPETKIEEVMKHLEVNLEEELPTRFDIYNAATAYVTHDVDGSITTRRKYDRRAENVMSMSEEKLSEKPEEMEVSTS